MDGTTFVLDTNVVSELMEAEPHPGVVERIDGIEPQSLTITTVTAAELLAGVASLPLGATRRHLVTRIGALLEIFDGRILPFDLTAATHYAEIVGIRRSLGRPISAFDAEIAAITRAHGAVLITRNIDDFAGVDLELMDPWTAPGSSHAPNR